MSICILADAADIDREKQIELEYMSVDDLKKCVSFNYPVHPFSSRGVCRLNKNKKLVKKLAKKYDALLQRLYLCKYLVFWVLVSPKVSYIALLVPESLDHSPVAGKFPTPISQADGSTLHH